MNILPWLDDLVELAPLLDRIIKDGVSLTVFVGIAVFLLKRYRKHKPTQIDRLERKVDILGERMGVDWHAKDLSTYSEVSATKSRSPSILRWAGSITARIASRFTIFPILENRRKNLMSNKLKSRKFILAVVSAALIIANDGLDLGIDSDTVLAFAGLVATWIIGEAAVDAKRAGNETKNDDTFSH